MKITSRRFGIPKKVNDGQAYNFLPKAKETTTLEKKQWSFAEKGKKQFKCKPPLNHLLGID